MTKFEEVLHETSFKQIEGEAERDERRMSAHVSTSHNI